MNNISNFSNKPDKIIDGENRKIYSFNSNTDSSNIDESVVQSFGEEWEKFNQFNDAEIEHLGKMYFDIVDEKMINTNTYVLDVGCGTGRWTKYLINKVAFIEAIDPSNAIFTADKLLGKKENVRLSQASTDNIPFNDETFDFVMSIGVLHHIPDTFKALDNCVKKVKNGGYFYVYLYYNLDNRGFAFKVLFYLVNAIRFGVSSLPSGLKKITCDIIAILGYMPIILLGRFIKVLGLNKVAKKMPLSFYHNQSFYIIRNDSLDRFGTKLEHRFSKKEIIDMMKKVGLNDICVSDKMPFWHAVGKRNIESKEIL